MKNIKIRTLVFVTIVKALFLVISFSQVSMAQVADGLYTITIGHSGKCLDVKGNSTANGGQIIQWECHGGNNQKWQIESVGNGTYKIISLSSGKSLDIPASSRTNGESIIQWGYHGGQNQQFRLQPVSGGYQLVSVLNGKCMDVPHSSHDNGVDIIQWPCTGNPNQLFTLVSNGAQGSGTNSLTPRTFDQYTWLTTHNSFTNYEDARWATANQSHGIIHQLNNGVRGLMLDVHYFEGDGDFRGGFTCGVSFGSDCYDPGLYLCHGGCNTIAGSTYALPRQGFSDTLHEIGVWLFNNTGKNDIVTIFLEDYASPTQLENAIRNAPAAISFIYNPSTDPDWKVTEKGWPTLEWMQKNNKRLIIFTGESANKNQWVAYQRELTVENYWSIGDKGNNYECTPKWGDTIPLNKIETGWNRLFVMNHFRNVPTTFTAAFDNGIARLNLRWDNYCEPAAGRLPNYLAVDFYELGSADVFVENKNQEWSELSGNIADTNPVLGPNANHPNADLFYNSKKEITVDIDCNHSKLTGTHTNSRVTVQFWASNNLVSGKYRDGVSNCSFSDATFSTKTWYKITHIIINTNGGDGFYIDELRVKKGGDQILWEGRDNGGGWCLSTDRTDATGDWKNYVANGCQSSIRFNLP